MNKSLGQNLAFSASSHLGNPLGLPTCHSNIYLISVNLAMNKDNIIQTLQAVAMSVLFNTLSKSLIEGEHNSESHWQKYGKEAGA